MNEELQANAVDLICEGLRDPLSNCRIVSVDALINLLRAGKHAAFGKAVKMAVAKVCEDENEEVRNMGIVAADLLNMCDQQ